MSTVERKCGTCIFWMKPSNRRAGPDSAFFCSAPIPEPVLPACVQRYWTYDHSAPRRTHMCREDGKGCPTWQRKATP